MSNWCMGGICPNASEGRSKEFTMGNGEFRPRCPGAETDDIGKAAKKTGFDKDFIEKCKLKTKDEYETLDERVERYMKCFSPTVDDLKEMYEAFVDELTRGLTLHRDRGMVDPKLCSFKMLDSYVKNIPTGKEQGTFYAIDFGGTNLRAVRCELQGNGSLAVSQHKTSLMDGNRSYSKGLMDAKASATELFDFFALTTKTFMEENGDISKGGNFNVGFTFSFPCNMRQINSATLVEWTKDFETGRATHDKVEGSDVCDLLQVAFDRNHVPGTVCAVMNDTVGTLLSCAYELDAARHPSARVGVILGTGMNACYYDESCNFFNYQGNIINIECGNFNRSLPRCNIDMEVDFASANRGAQLLEKMVSGAYLGEICRRTVVKVFQSRCPPKAWLVHTLTTELASSIATDDIKTCEETRKVIRDIWDTEMELSDLRHIQKICLGVFDRSAALSAVFIAACAHKTGYLQSAMGGLSVGVDGSLYKCNKFFRQRLRGHIDSVIGKERSGMLHLVNADDGSGKGAVVVASQLVGA